MIIIYYGIMDLIRIYRGYKKKLYSQLIKIDTLLLKIIDSYSNYLINHSYHDF